MLFLHPLLKLLGGLPHVASLEGGMEVAPGEIASDGVALDNTTAKWS